MLGTVPAPGPGVFPLPAGLPGFAFEDGSVYIWAVPRGPGSDIHLPRSRLPSAAFQPNRRSTDHTKSQFGVLGSCCSSSRSAGHKCPAGCLGSCPLHPGQNDATKPSLRKAKSSDCDSRRLWGLGDGGCLSRFGAQAKLAWKNHDPQSRARPSQPRLLLWYGPRHYKSRGIASTNRGPAHGMNA